MDVWSANRPLIFVIDNSGLPHRMVPALLQTIVCRPLIRIIGRDSSANFPETDTRTGGR